MGFKSGKPPKNVVLEISEEKLIHHIRIFNKVHRIMGENEGRQRSCPDLEQHVYPPDYRGGNNMVKPETPVDKSEGNRRYQYDVK